MKKVIFLFFYLVSVGIVFTGCSGDDDDSSLGVPEYESISGKYSVQGNSTYSSIELGASGNYIITKSTINGRSVSAAGRDASDRSVFFKNKPSGISRSKLRSIEESIGDGIVFGTYTINDDGSLNLQGFGTLKIVYSGSLVTNMTLTPTNGSTVTLDVEKEETYPDSDLTNKLCRTWNLVSVSGKEYDENGKLIYSFVGSLDVAKQTWAWDVKVDESGWGEPESYNPSQILFSKSGTYLVYYTDGTALLRNWKWKNESSKTLYYKEIEDEDYFDDYWTTLSFSGNKVTFTETYSDEEGRTESATVMEAVN